MFDRDNPIVVIKSDADIVKYQRMFPEVDFDIVECIVPKSLIK